MLALHSPVEGFVAFTVQDPGRGIVVTTGFKPKSKLPVLLGRLYTLQSVTVSLIKPTTSHIRSILKNYWIGTGGQSMEKTAYQIDITVRN